MNKRGWMRAAIVAALALAAVLCVAYPMYVIWPFRYQGATELQIALWVAQVGPWVSLICAVACLVVLAASWQRMRAGARAVAIIAVVFAGLGAWLSRVDIYEQMFHPAGTPQFAAADRAKIDADDMVLAIRVNGESHAYPIREIAYHHVINDTIAGEPVVATY